MWSKAKAFFKYGNRMEKSTSSNKSTEVSGASVLFDKMVNTEIKELEKEGSKKEIKYNDTKKASTYQHHSNKNKQQDSGKSVQKKYQVPSNNGHAYNTANEKKQAAIKDNYKGPICQYCGKQTIIKTAKEHIGKDENYCYWTCPKCADVSVTTIKGGYTPAGIPADAETRKLRVNAHKYLYSKKSDLKFNSNALNKWISAKLSISVERAWIGQLNKEELIDIVLIRQNEIYEEKYSDIFNKIS